VKHSKFNLSGQLLVFQLLSLVWALELTRRENPTLSLSSLWAGKSERERQTFARRLSEEQEEEQL
jgi:hypothetical protein